MADEVPIASTHNEPEASRSLNSFLASPLIRITVVSVVGTLLALLVLTGYLQTALRDQAMARWIDDKSHALVGAAREVDGRLVMAQERLRFLAALPAFRAAPNPDLVDRHLNGVAEQADPQRRAAMDWLLQETEHGIRVLYLLLANGDFYLTHPFSTQQRVTTATLANRPYFQQARASGQLTLSDAFIGADGVPAVAMLLPITDDDGAVHSYLGGVFDLARIAEFIAAAVRPTAQEVDFLFDRNGRLITHHGEVTDSHWQVLNRPPLNARAATPSVPAEGDYPLTTEFLPGQGAEGGRRIIATTLRAGWRLGAVRDVASINREILPDLYRIVGMAALLLALINVLGIVVTWRIGSRWRAVQRAQAASLDGVVSEQKRAEAALRESEHYLRTLADGGSTLIWTSGRDRLCDYVNDPWVRFTGQARDAALGDGWMASVHPEDLQRRRRTFLRAFARQQSFSIDYRLRHADGGYRWVNDRAMPRYDSEGAFLGYIGFCLDITEQRRSAEAVAHEKAVFEAIFNGISDAIVYASVAREVIAINPGFSAIFGYEIGDLLGKKTAFFYASPMEYERHGGESFNSSVGHQEQPLEVLYRKKDGELFTGETLGSAITGADGELMGFIGVIRDISERKQAELAMAESEARLRTLTETARDAIVTVDTAQRIVYWNAAAEQIFGYPRAEVLGLALTRLIPEALRARHEEHFANACRSGRLRSDGTPVELTALTQSGEEIPVEFSLSTWEAQGERFFTSFIRDISQRRQHEATIRTLSLAVEQSPVSIVITNLEGEIEFVNQAFVDITGYEPQQVLGQNPRLLQSGETPHRVYQELWQNITSGQPWQGEILNRKKNGERYWEYARISPVINDLGDTTHYMAIKEDITQIKRSEQALRTSLRLRKTLSACNQSLVRSTSESAFLAELCSAIVSEGRYPFVWVGYAEDADAQTLRVQVQAGDDQGYLNQFDDRTRGAHIAGDAIRSRRPLLGHPAQQKPPQAWEQRGLERGFNSSIALPVVDEKHGLYAVLRIYGHNPTGFEGDEQALLRELAEDLRYGIVSHRVRTALDESAAQFRSLSEDSMVGVYMIRANHFVYVNPRMAEIFGYLSKDDLIGLSVAQLVAPADRARVLENLRIRLSGAMQSVHYEFNGQRQDGRLVQVEVFGARTQYGGESAVVGSLLDITERNRDTEHLRMLQRALEASNEGIAISDHRLPDNPFIYINPAFEALTGFTEDEVIGRNGRFLLGDNRAQPELNTLVQSMRQGRPAQVQLQNYRKNGAMFWNQLSVAPVRDDGGALTHYVSVVQDVTERRYYTQQLERLTHFDTLTGLANRNLLLDRLAQALIHDHREGRLTALLLLDIHRFKVLTQTLGTVDAERILVKVAQRLSEQVRKGDTVARTGNDQFAILLDNLVRESDLPVLAQGLLNRIAEPCDIGPEGLRISASIGITVAPADGDSAEQLLGNAHAALMKAYADKSNFRFFTPQMNTEASKRLELETDLRRAVDEQQFVLFYQPKIRLSDGQIMGAEALIRWQHPVHGLVFPDLFIPLAEETGLIRAMGDWVLQSACTFVAQLNLELSQPISIAVNFSVEQFKEADLVDKVAKALSDSGLASHLLECELTESLLMSDPEGAVASLKAIKSLGALVALDDFGTGYSSLSYLKRFPIDTLKIDRSFVADIPGDEHDVAIVKAVIALAETLGLYVVAEGVETLEQAQFLRVLGCQSVQGYYFSKPIPAEQFAALLRKQERYALA